MSNRSICSLSYAVSDRIACPWQAFDLKLMIAFSFCDRCWCHFGLKLDLQSWSIKRVPFATGFAGEADWLCQINSKSHDWNKPPIRYMHQVLLQSCFDLPTGILQNKQVSNNIILFPHMSYAFQDQIACPWQAFDLKLMVAFAFYDKWWCPFGLKLDWQSWFIEDCLLCLMSNSKLGCSRQTPRRCWFLSQGIGAE